MSRGTTTPLSPSNIDFPRPFGAIWRTPPQQQTSTHARKYQPAYSCSVDGAPPGAFLGGGDLWVPGFSENLRGRLNPPPPPPPHRAEAKPCPRRPIPVCCTQWVSQLLSRAPFGQAVAQPPDKVVEGPVPGPRRSMIVTTIRPRPRKPKSKGANTKFVALFLSPPPPLGFECSSSVVGSLGCRGRGRALCPAIRSCMLSCNRSHKTLRSGLCGYPQANT